MAEWDDLRVGDLMGSGPGPRKVDAEEGSETAELDPETYPHLTRLLSLNPADFKRELDSLVQESHNLKAKAPKASRALQVMAQILGEMYRNKR